MFGGKSAPYHFNLFAKVLHWIIQCHIPAQLCHYLDDFLPIFRPSVPLKTASAAIGWIENLGKELGLLFQPAKTICPTTHLEFLGLELDSQAMEARLPIEKLGYLHELLDSWMGCKACVLKELQELVGFLQFCAHVIPHGRTLICGLINFSMTFPDDFSQRHVPGYA